MVRHIRKRARKTLLTVTKTILATFISNPHLHKPYAVNLNQAYQELQELVATIAVELDLGEEVEAMQHYANLRTTASSTTFRSPSNS